jgi:hypothetical protein
MAIANTAAAERTDVFICTNSLFSMVIETKIRGLGPLLHFPDAPPWASAASLTAA